MSVIRLRNSLAPQGKVVLVSTALQLVVDDGTAGGEEKWILTLSTAETDVSGTRIQDVIIDTVEGDDSLDEKISEALAAIAAQVVWTDTEQDTKAPKLVSQSHSNGQTNVDVGKDVFFVLEDPLPSSGIDISTISLVANGVDVTDNLVISGDSRHCEIQWVPLRLLN